jgi:glycosyltransferase involved in cell wall biosynthesis
MRTAQREAFGIGRDEIWLVFVGRLTAEKGADVLLRALAAQVGASGLLIVGDGPQHSWLENQVLATSIPVRFCGYQQDVTPFLAMADVFVQPSRSEGLPFAALEAMAHGLPVVASRVGGLPGAVGDAGLLVPSEDPSALAGAMRTMCGDADLRRNLGEAGRRRVAHEFDQTRMIATLEATYEEAAQGVVPATAMPASPPPPAAAGARPRS